MKMKIIIKIKTLAFFILSTLPAISESSENKVKLIYSLSSYIYSNYHTAVKDNKVISELEYDEMIRFSQEVFELMKTLEKGKFKNFDSALKAAELLHTKVLEKAEAKDVEDLAKELINFSIVNGGLTLTHLPDFAEGEKIYKAMCLVCHGERGEGVMQEGEMVGHTNLSKVSPARVFLTTMFGIEGTPMRSFDLQDKQRWSLSFYVSALKYLKEHKAEQKDSETKANVKIQQILDSIHMNNDELEKTYSEDLAQQIRESIFNIGHVEFLKKALEESFELVKNSEFEKARALLSSAYMIFEEVEPTLKIRNASDVTFVEIGIQKILQEISKLEGAIDHKNIGEIQNITEVVLKRLDKLESSAGKYGKDLSAFIVVFREGVEAILIIAAILGVVSAVKISPIPVYSGGVFGVVLGVALWELTGKIMKINQEVMEGVVTLLAVLVIIWVSFWVLEKVRVGRLEAFMKKVRTAAYGKNYVWLFLVSFLATSREAGETVLFLRAIGGGEVGIVLGFFSLIFVAVVVYFAKLKLPLRSFFLGTNILLNVLAVVLIGKAIEEFQEAGIIPITFVGLPFLGVYTTLQKFLPQLTLFLLLFGATAVGVLHNLKASKMSLESKPI